MQFNNAKVMNVIQDYSYRTLFQWFLFWIPLFTGMIVLKTIMDGSFLREHEYRWFHTFNISFNNNASFFFKINYFHAIIRLRMF